jgi:hypothetical protein
MGGEGARDVAIAAEVCSRLGWRHRICSIDPDSIPVQAQVYATILNGSGPLQNAYAVARCEQFRGQVDRMFNGYRGGVVLGTAIVDLGLKPRIRWWRGRLRMGPPTVSPNLEDARDPDSMAAYYSAMSHQAAPRVAAWCVVPEPSTARMFQAALAGPLADTPPCYQLEQWTEEYGGGRHYSLCSIYADRHFYADDSVFYDYDVRDRCFALDPALRRFNRAYAAVLDRLVPELASVTYANTGLPANRSGHRLMLARLLRRITAGPTTVSTGLRPSTWLRRTGIREFAADVVHSDSFRSRPWWHGDMIVKDFDVLLKGRPGLESEFWNAIALELFARRWLDPSPQESG